VSPVRFTRPPEAVSPISSPRLISRFESGRPDSDIDIDTLRGGPGRLVTLCRHANFHFQATAVARAISLTSLDTAGPILLPTHPHPTGDMSLTNGHSTEVDESRLGPSPPSRRSESELSDLNELPTTTMSSASPPDDADASEDDAIHDMATSELDDEDDAPGEEDADFDEETPPPAAGSRMRQDESMSEDSGRPGKRKADDVEDEEFMKQNPELYGLRRSVSA